MDQMNEAKLLLYKQIKKIFKKQVTLKILYLIELHMDQMNEAKLLLYKQIKKIFKKQVTLKILYFYKI